MYRFMQFDGLTLPASAPVYPVGSNDSENTIVRLPGGGYFDAQGAERSPYRLPIPETFHVEFVDPSATALLTAYQALMAKRGVYGKLYRQSDTGVIHWCYARLMRIPALRKIPDNRSNQPVDIDFLRMTSWYYNALVNMGSTLYNAATWIVTNSGTLSVENVIINITAVTLDLTGLTITNNTLNIAFSFSQTISAGNILTLDVGAHSCLNNGVAAWRYLTEPQNSKFWMVLAPGNNYFTASLGSSSNNNTIAFSFYPPWE